MSAPLPPPNPWWTLHVGLLALQVSLIVLTGGALITTLICLYDMLALARRTLTDIIRLSRIMEERAGSETRKSS